MKTQAGPFSRQPFDAHGPRISGKFARKFSARVIGPAWQMTFVICLCILEGTPNHATLPDALREIGVAGIVLEYRVPRREGTPRDRPPVQALMDAQRALSLVRSKAGESGIDPKRVGILGFSTGGHLSTWAATHFDERAFPAIDDVDKLSCRPDFAVLVYPGGMDRKGDASSPIAHVSSTTPPMFLAQAGDDPVDCRNSVEMFLALRNAKVPAGLHIYNSGGHGFGLRPSEHPCSTWPRRCEEWLRDRQIVPASRPK